MAQHHSLHIIDVNEADFQAQVIDQSHQIPVVVDFWAPWCGPCRTLGPILERLASEAAGAWILAKVNVDNNQRLSQTYGVQGIPAVKAFRNGGMCEQFTGAIPESQIRTWLKRIIPDASDSLLVTLKHLATTNPVAALHPKNTPFPSAMALLAEESVNGKSLRPPSAIKSLLSGSSFRYSLTSTSSCMIRSKTLAPRSTSTASASGKAICSKRARSAPNGF